MLPMISVSVPMNTSTIFSPVAIPRGIRLILGAVVDGERAFVARVEAVALGEHPAHLRDCLFVELRVDCLQNDGVKVILVEELLGDRVRNEDAALVGPEVARQLSLVGQHADDLEGQPSNPDRPATAGPSLANRFRATSVPRNATRRRRSTSSALTNCRSPCFGPHQAVQLGRHAARTPADVARLPKVNGSVSKISGPNYSIWRQSCFSGSMSASLRYSFRPRARRPPACWSDRRGGHAVRDALAKPNRSARWNPLPYAISDVTVRIPHAIPEHRQSRPEAVGGQRVPGLGEDFFEEHLFLVSGQ